MPLHFVEYLIYNLRVVSSHSEESDDKAPQNQRARAVFRLAGRFGFAAPWGSKPT